MRERVAKGGAEPVGVPVKMSDRAAQSGHGARGRPDGVLVGRQFDDAFQFVQPLDVFHVAARDIRFKTGHLAAGFDERSVIVHASARG